MSSTAGSGVGSIRVICGPTAAGKSALALRLAEEMGGAIVSADSRQIYRRFDIGTAKATPGERARIPHFGVDLVEPTARFSAAEWAHGVTGWTVESRALGRVPIVVGGTGFYLRALFAPLFEAPRVDVTRRGALEEFLAPFSTDELRRWCRTVDPSRAHLGRTQLERAIETAMLAGVRISELHATRARAPVHAARYLLVDPGRALTDAIGARVDRMLDAGWLDEVRAIAQVVPAGAPAWTATGYEPLREVIAGGLTIREARETIVMRTRQYAKRQRTWFRHQLPVGLTSVLDPRAADAVERAISWWRAEEH